MLSNNLKVNAEKTAPGKSDPVIASFPKVVLSQ